MNALLLGGAPDANWLPLILPLAVVALVLMGYNGIRQKIRSRKGSA